MNKVFEIGRLVRDPELKFNTAGTPFCKFTIAIDRFKKGEADFIPCTCMNKQAENVANNLSKGRLVAVSGAIRTGSYKNSEGKTIPTWEVFADEVKFLDWPKDTVNLLDKDGSLKNDFSPVDDDDIPF